MFYVLITENTVVIFSSTFQGRFLNDIESSLYSSSFQAYVNPDDLW